MKQLIFFALVALTFTSCTKKYDFECVTYPNWIDRAPNGIDPNTGQAINMVTYYIKKESLISSTKNDAKDWIKQQEQDTSINAKCTANKQLID